MTAIHYSARKLLPYAAFVALPAVVMLWMIGAPGMFLAYRGWLDVAVHFVANNVWLSGALLAVSVFVSFNAFRLALGDRTALAFGEDGVEVRTLFRRHRFGWAEVAGIDFKPRTAMQGASLSVRVKRGSGERKLVVFVNLLEQSPEQVARLVETVERR